MGDVNIGTRVERHSRLASRRSDLNYKPEPRSDNFIWGGPQRPACQQGVPVSVGTFLIKNRMKTLRSLSNFPAKTARDALYRTVGMRGIILPLYFYFSLFFFSLSFMSFTYISLDPGGAGGVQTAPCSSRNPHTHLQPS